MDTVQNTDEPHAKACLLVYLFPWFLVTCHPPRSLIGKLAHWLIALSALRLLLSAARSSLCKIRPRLYNGNEGRNAVFLRLPFSEHYRIPTRLFADAAFAHWQPALFSFPAELKHAAEMDARVLA